MATNIETTVCFFKDLYKTLAAISTLDAGILMRALFAEANGVKPDFEGSQLAEALFTMAADQMHRLESFRRKKATKSKTEQTGANGSKEEQNGANGSKEEQNGANGSKTEQTGAKRSKREQTGAPYPYPYPYKEKYIKRKSGVQRNPKIQARYGFGTERQDVDYNEIAKKIREQQEEAAAE